MKEALFILILTLVSGRGFAQVPGDDGNGLCYRNASLEKQENQVPPKTTEPLIQPKTTGDSDQVIPDRDVWYIKTTLKNDKGDAKSTIIYAETHGEPVRKSTEVSGGRVIRVIIPISENESEIRNGKGELMGTMRFSHRYEE
jgi:hypothetical protein